VAAVQPEVKPTGGYSYGLFTAEAVKERKAFLEPIKRNPK